MTQSWTSSQSEANSGFGVPNHQFIDCKTQLWVRRGTSVAPTASCGLNANVTPHLTGIYRPLGLPAAFINVSVGIQGSKETKITHCDYTVTTVFHTINDQFMQRSSKASLLCYLRLNMVLKPFQLDCNIATLPHIEKTEHYSLFWEKWKSIPQKNKNQSQCSLV